MPSVHSVPHLAHSPVFHSLLRVTTRPRRTHPFRPWKGGFNQCVASSLVSTEMAEAVSKHRRTTLTLPVGVLNRRGTLISGKPVTIPLICSPCSRGAHPLTDTRLPSHIGFLRAPLTEYASVFVPAQTNITRVGTRPLIGQHLPDSCLLSEAFFIAEAANALHARIIRSPRCSLLARRRSAGGSIIHARDSSPCKAGMDDPNEYHHQMHTRNSAASRQRVER